MKKLLALVVALIIIVAILPWITGYYFKQQYIDLITAYNAKHPGRITIIDYQAGWFSSNAKLNINPISADDLPPQAQNNLSAAAEFLKSTALTLDQHISHGPFVRDPINNSFTFALASIQTTLHLSEKIETLLFGATKPDGVGTVSVLAALDREWTYRVQLFPMDLSFMTIDKTHWEGIDGTVSFKTNADDTVTQVNSKFVFGNLNVAIEDAGEKLELALTPITQSGSWNYEPVGLWTGQTDITLPGAVFKINNVLHYGMEKLLLAGNSNVTGNMYNLVSTLTINNLTLTDYVVPSISLLQYKLAINNLNAMELVHFISAAQTTQNKPNPQDEMMTVYQTVLPRVITPSSTVNLDVVMNTSLGGFTAKGNAIWPANTALPNTMEETAKNVNGKVDIRIAIPLANAFIDQAVNSMAAQAIQQMPATPAVTTITPETPVDANKDTLKNKLMVYMQNGQLPLPAAIQIMSLYDSHASPDAFATNVKQLRLAPPIETEIIQLYTQLATAPQPTTPIPAVPTTVQPQMAPSQLQKDLSGSLKDQVNQLIKEGYLIQDGNDYIATLTYINNTLKINNKDFAP